MSVKEHDEEHLPSGSKSLDLSFPALKGDRVPGFTPAWSLENILILGIATSNGLHKHVSSSANMLHTIII